MSNWMVTANRLSDGRVVYLRADRTWTEHFDEAAITADEARADADVAWALTQTEEIVEPYKIDVRVEADGPRPTSARERIRAEGPQGVLSRFGYLRAQALKRAAAG